MKKNIFLFLLFLSSLHGTSVNLFQQGVLFGGSSFSGIAESLKVSRDYYYDKACDGDESTFWLPWNRRGPHEISWCFRTPVTADCFSWNGRKVEGGVLYAEIDDKWQKIAVLDKNKGAIKFSRVVSSHFKLIWGKDKGVICLYEIGMRGPSQPLIPSVLPMRTKSSPEIVLTAVDFCSDLPRVKMNCHFCGESLPDNLFAMLRMGDKPAQFIRRWGGDIRIGDYVAARIGGDSGNSLCLKADFRLPNSAPSGALPYTLEVYGGTPLKQYRVISEVEFPEINNGPAFKIMPSGPMKASLDEENGIRGFRMNRQFAFPFFHRYMRMTSYDRLHESLKTGIDLYNYLIYYSCVGVKEKYPGYFRRLDQQIKATLNKNPRAKFLITMDLRPDKLYLMSHPSELMRDCNGEIIREKNNKYGLISFGSQHFYNEMTGFIDALFQFLEAQPYFSRIIAYQPFINSANDAFIGGVAANGWSKRRDNLRGGDFHPGAIEKFRQYLRRKYGSDRNLQKSWCSNSVTLATASVPDNLLGEDYPGGVFRNADGSQAVFDYWEFFPSLLGDTLRALAAHLKMRSDGKALVYMHYGAVIHTLCLGLPTGVRFQSNNNDLYHLINDPNIDMFAQSFSYQYRHAGEPISCYHAIDTLNLHDKMYLADYDARTFSCGEFTYGRHRSIEETQALLIRDLSFLILKGGGAWLSDMCQGNPQNFENSQLPWLSNPGITSVIHRLLNMYQKISDRHPLKSVSEIAVWLSVDSVRYEDALNSAVVYRGIRGMLETEFSRLGAPYDIYLLDDISRLESRGRKYKVHFFMNAFCLGKKEIKAIERLKQDGNTLIWFYAPGYLNDNGRQSASDMQKITGMAIHADNTKKGILSTRLHACDFWSTGLPSVCECRTYRGAEHLHPEIVSPRFHVTDQAVKILGENSIGQVNFAMKQHSGWQSIYCEVPNLSVSILRNIVEKSGVHLYTAEPAYVMADNHFLIIHNGMEQSRKFMVRLPEKERLMDALSGEILLQGGKQCDIYLKNPETRIIFRRKQ